MIPISPIGTFSELMADISLVDELFLIPNRSCEAYHTISINITREKTLEID